MEWWDYERRGYEAITDMKWRTWEHEKKDEDQGDKMDWDENTRLMCEWLVLDPLRGIKDVTSIYTCLWALHVVPCIDPHFHAEDFGAFGKLLKTPRTWNR